MAKEDDVKKKQQQLAKQMKFVDNETGRPRVKDIVSVIRSAVRKSWMRSPVKLSLMMKSAVHVDDIPKGSLPKGITKASKWLYLCEMCEEYHIASKIQYDHREGEHSLKGYEDMVKFTQSILDVGWDDLAQLCIDCHSVKTYSERYGLTYEQAKREKEVITIMNQSAVKQREFIKSYKLSPASNADKRRDQIREIIHGK